MCVFFLGSMDFSLNFYIVHVNTFCYVTTANMYYPAEIAVCRFSLEKGVTENGVFHKMCHPGEILLMIYCLVAFFNLL